MQQNMISKNNVELLIFDLDGTLFKSDKCEFETIKKALLNLGWNINITMKEIKRQMGKISEHYYKRMLPPDKVLRWEELAEEVRKQRSFTIAKYGKTFPDVIKTLNILKKRGYKLALYTNSSSQYLKTVVSFLNIEKYFNYMECIEENDLTKVELIRKIKNKLGESKAAVIGDRIHDIEAAKENGALSVGVLYGYGKKEPREADITINKFSELLNIFDRRLSIFEQVLKGIKERKQKDRAFIVGINGIDTSGKTKFAESFENFLISKKHKVQLINLDDFHNPKKIRYSGENQADNYYNKGFNIDAIVKKLLIPIHQKNDFTERLTLLNLHTDKYEIKKEYVFDQDTIVVFEGVFLFRKELSRYIDYKIFIEVPFKESRERARVRDVPIFGEEILKKYDEKYFPAQKKYLKEFPSSKIADMMIDNSNWEYPKIKQNFNRAEKII